MISRLYDCDCGHGCNSESVCPSVYPTIQLNLQILYSLFVNQVWFQESNYLHTHRSPSACMQVNIVFVSPETAPLDLCISNRNGFCMRCPSQEAGRNLSLRLRNQAEWKQWEANTSHAYRTGTHLHRLHNPSAHHIATHWRCSSRWGKRSGLLHISAHGRLR